MIYREVREAQRLLSSAQDHIRAAVLADDTREMTVSAGSAQAITDGVKRRLDSILEQGFSNVNDRGDAGIDRTLIQASRESLTNAVTTAQGVELATNAHQLRDRLLDFKTQIDFADAYLQAAIGSDEG